MLSELHYRDSNESNGDEDGLNWVLIIVVRVVNIANVVVRLIKVGVNLIRNIKTQSGSHPRVD